MRTIKFKLYALEILLILSLLFALFVLNNGRRLFVMITLIIVTIVTILLFNHNKSKSIFKKQVSLLMFIFSLIYLGLFYILGFFYGFVKSKYIFSFQNVLNVIIPTIVIIVLSEIIRERFLLQNSYIKIRGRKINISIILTYIAIYSLSSLNDFLMIVGFVFFSSLSSNLLYNYMSKRFGCVPVIIFKLITSIYIYIIPYVPDVYIFLRTFLKMIVPFIIYLIIERIYYKSFYKTARGSFWKTGLMTTVLILIIMLISCQFRYGIIVIGSDSMTGTINKGDAVIFKKYNNELIDEGQVIIFEYNNIKTVHRVVNRKSVNGEIRYITKGDSNKKEDGGYRKSDNIRGIVKIRIKYIGLPTLWFRSLFGE